MFSILASGLAVFSEGRYIVSIVRGKSIPSFPSWLVFAVSMASVFASAYSLEARSSLALIGTFAILNGAIALLALRYGITRFTKVDVIFLALSGIGLLLWWETSNPWYALLMSVLVDTCGYCIMFWKQLRYPGSEDRLAWGMSAIAYSLNLLVISQWVPQEYLFSLLNTLWCTTAFLLTFRTTRINFGKNTSL